MIDCHTNVCEDALCMRWEQEDFIDTLAFSLLSTLRPPLFLFDKTPPRTASVQFKTEQGFCAVSWRLLSFFVFSGSISIREKIPDATTSTRSNKENEQVMEIYM